MAPSKKKFKEKLQKKLVGTNSKLNVISENPEEKNTRLQRSVNFLRLQFDGLQAEGVFKTDATIFDGQNDDEPVIHAHQIILAHRSSVLKSMFEADMLEGRTGRVYMRDATIPVIRAVIYFCYRAEVDFSEEVTAEDVLSLAHSYLIHFLVGICEEHLMKTTDISNLSARMALAEKFDLNRLKEAADRLNEAGSSRGCCMP